MIGLDRAIRNSASRSGDRLELWETLLDMLNPSVALEVGVFKGRFAARVLARSRSIQSYWMIDPWRNLPQWNKPLNTDNASLANAYTEAMRAVAFAKGRVAVLRGTTTEVIDQIPDDSIDFAYIDGDHTLRGITVDLINVWPKIRAGGWLCGDDLSPTIWQHAKSYEPTLVFPMAVHFSEAMGARMFAMPYQQYLIEKPERGKRQHSFTDLTGNYTETVLLRQIQE